MQGYSESQEPAKSAIQHQHTTVPIATATAATSVHVITANNAIQVVEHVPVYNQTNV